MLVRGGEAISDKALVAVCESRAATTSDDRLRKANCASVCADHASGHVVQKVGSLSATASIDIMN